MKRILFLITFLASACLSFGQGNWPISGTKNRWGNGMGFSSKSATQLSAFTNGSDTLLLEWDRDDSTLTIRNSVFGPWRKLVTNATLTGYVPYIGATSAVNLGTFSLTTTSTLSASTITGTLTTAAQPNITTVGTLAQLTVTGYTKINNYFQVTPQGRVGIGDFTGGYSPDDSTGHNQTGSWASTMLRGPDVRVFWYGRQNGFNNGFAPPQVPADVVGFLQNQYNDPPYGGMATGGFSTKEQAYSIYGFSGLGDATKTTVSLANSTVRFSKNDTSNHATLEQALGDDENGIAIKNLNTVKVFITGNGSQIPTTDGGPSIGSSSRGLRYGNIIAKDTVKATVLTGTLSTAAQPNITSVGQLTSLSVSGTVQAGNITSTTATIGSLTLAAPLTTTSGGTGSSTFQYQTGSWTPSLTCGTSGTITLNGNYSRGEYTVIGDRVFATVYLVVSSVSSPVGSLTLNGLPFTVATSPSGGSNNNLGAGSIFVAAASGSAGVFQIIPNSNATTAFISSYSAGVSGNAAGFIQANTELVISLNYRK